MCRHLAYLGPPRTLSQVLLEPPHGLLEQAWAPSDMRGGGTINVDGFGAGWYPPLASGDGVSDPVAAVTGDDVSSRAVRAGSAGVPVRMRSVQPIWSDTSFAAVARVTVATGVLGAVRAASPGMPVVSTANAPFTEDRWLFSHNGMVFGWPDALEALGATLPVLDLMTLDAPTDAALIWALVRHRLRAGHDPADVLAGTVRAVDEASPGSRLNLLLTDGTTIWATAWRHALAVHTVSAADGNAPSVTVASEPTDAHLDWTQVPDRHLVVARPGHHELYPLDTPEHPVAASGRGTEGAR
ncbi:ergothioneine biosynthesis protein EgtC [Pseudonocardia endophytica]|uniref:Gamma-glutamyl-hercynylcysteine sulfoxide hydrolase n=1 Tax=Pseudonocardia endophytica TaxID=401976 RepID=A0A4R1I318_PSEEN|nr:ergothioneine biosynthesis protein EgtC [Pseudonocardia endophytica]TCK24352.1 glutamine amidotransferase [Pseudonocardia endophytica]